MLGIDMIEIERIKAAIQRFGARFLNKVFTSKEQAYCEQFKNKYERYAARFAAKEAVAKVLEQGPKNFWLDIEVLHAENGAPRIQLSPRVYSASNKTIHISLSHCKEHAIAVAQLSA